MDTFDIVVGAVTSVCGVFALAAGVFRRDGTSVPLRLLALSFGLAFITYGVVRFSAGVGASWATMRLRSSLYIWFAIPCLAAWLFAWFSERHKRR